MRIAFRLGNAALLVMVLCIASLGDAAAQTSVPPSPGTMMEGLEVHRALLPGGPPQVIFSHDEPENPHDRQGRRFLVKGFHFTGNNVFSEAQLRRVVERFVDLQLNLFDLNKAADAVTAFYRDQGFPISVALLPAQRIDDGLVSIEVVEGRIGVIAFDGPRRYSSDYLREYLEPFEVDQQLTMAKLERSLLLLNDLPGLTARATLTPGQSRGETDVTLSIEETPIALRLQANNGGRKEAGAVRFEASAEINNPLGIGDQLTLRDTRSSERLMRYQRIGYNLPVGQDGLRLGIASSETNYRVAGNFAVLDIKGLVTSNEASLTYPLLRSRDANVVTSAGYRTTSIEQSVLSSTFPASTLSLVSVGASSNWVDADSSASTLSTVYSSNFKNNYHNEADALRGKLDVDFTRLTGISSRWDLFMRGNIVLGAGAVPDTEKFSLGGQDSVRGYQSSEYRGDRGFLTTIEFRRQFVAQGIPGIFSAFQDYGGVGNSGFAGQDKLSSVGSGVTIFPSKNSRLRLDAAWPTRNYVASDEKTGPRLWASGSLSF